MGKTAWFDTFAGVAGDMLLGALVDAGAELAAIQAAVDAVVPGAVQLVASQVQRQSQRATKVDVEVLVGDQPHRQWRQIRQLLLDAELAEITRDRALATFTLLAEAEGRVHGIDPDEVHFHEVGALDSIADVVGVCEALRLLGITQVIGSPIAVGSGQVWVAHGLMPVPVPAVAQLSIGWPTMAGELPGVDGQEDGHHQHSHDHDHDHQPGHDHHRHTHDQQHAHHQQHPHDDQQPRQLGELATPTGVALIRSLAERCGPLPAMITQAIGVGAGTKDTIGRPNVVRVVVGQTNVASVPDQAVTQPAATGVEELATLSANLDDLEPRLWPGVLDALLGAGALDAWLVPILMKKGRPAQLLQVLCRLADAERLAEMMLNHTSTFGVRQAPVSHRFVLDRLWRQIEVADQPVRIKLGLRAGVIVRATPEWDDVAAAAKASGLSEIDLLREAEAKAQAVGYRLGAEFTG